ncbi:MAG TPA: hypothetical protein VF170_17990 [Planctomycetaceae bacterium]
MTDLETYRNRLAAMRDRLRRQIDDEVEIAREAIRKPGESVNLHTHNADMDVEGLDPAVGVGHALERRLATVEEMILRLDREGESLLKNERERERIDAYLDTEDFAERLRDGASGGQAAADVPDLPKATERSGQSTGPGTTSRRAK